MERFMVTILVCLVAGLSESAGEPTNNSTTDNNMENNDRETEISAILSRNTTEKRCNELIYTMLKDLGALEERLAVTVRAVEETNKKLEATEKKLSALNSTVTDLSTEEKGKVAFSATLQLNGNIGPLGVIYPLVYRNVLSNIGGHYSPQTGYFTAPVKGVYYFTFSSFCWENDRGCGGGLYQNENSKVSWYSYSRDHPTSGSNKAILALEAGDMVNVRLWSNRIISDNGNNYVTFSGFLLFTI